jgi:hypothetical protein
LTEKIRQFSVLAIFIKRTKKNKSVASQHFYFSLFGFVRKALYPCKQYTASYRRDYGTELVATAKAAYG